MAISAQAEQILERSARHIAGGVVSLNRKADPQIVFTQARQPPDRCRWK